MIVKTLNLKEVNIINTRIEDYSTKTREKYDVVVSRAVAPIKHLLEYAVPLLKVNGYFIALKGNIEEETQNIDNYYKNLYNEIFNIIMRDLTTYEKIELENLIYKYEIDEKLIISKIKEEGELNINKLKEELLKITF